MTSVRRLTWERETQRGHAFHLARHRVPPGGVIACHDHDFAEVFWIEAGSGDHRTAQGTLALEPGTVACVQPRDAHGMRAGPQGLVLVNVSFPPRPVAALARGRSWPWRRSGQLAHRRMRPSAMERLHDWAAELAQPGAGQADLDAFLLDLARMLQRDPAQPVALPPQLEQACTAFSDPAHLRGGTPALARLCGCGPAHLNRLCRRWHGCTASELVARLRLDWAARELRLTAEPIAALADACGMPHLGHFYRRFRQRFGTTPKAWRDAAWSLFAPVERER